MIFFILAPIIRITIGWYIYNVLRIEYYLNFTRLSIVSYLISSSMLNSYLVIKCMKYKHEWLILNFHAIWIKKLWNLGVRICSCLVLLYNYLHILDICRVILPFLYIWICRKWQTVVFKAWSYYFGNVLWVLYHYNTFSMYCLCTFYAI